MARQSMAARVPTRRTEARVRSMSLGVQASSPLRSSTPPAGSNSASRPSSPATPSRSLKNSRCSRPMPVMTPNRGWIMLTRGASSPGWFVPASRTATRWVFSSRRRVNGTPMSLLKLASLQSAGIFWRSTEAISSLVLVLPLDPATAMTGSVKPLRYFAAIRPSATRVSGTVITAQPSGSEGSLARLIRTAATPCRAVSFRKS